MIIIFINLVPEKLDVLNLILKNNPNQYDLNAIEKKMLNLNQSLMNQNTALSPTDKLFYRYNVLYGAKSNNLIRTYSPKLRPKSASVSQYVKTINRIHVDNGVFSDEDVMLLFESKSRDILVEPKAELHQRFSEYAKKKCVDRIINLSECNLGIFSINTICDFIEKNEGKCSRLVLARNNIGDRGAEIVMDMLEKNNCLLHLDLSSNDIGVRGGNAIFKTLVNHQSLISLNLSSLEGVNRNRISTEGVREIENVLKTNKFLEYLNLSGNSIKNDGVKYLMCGLNMNDTLKYLDISKNEIDEKGAENIKTYLKESKLVYFNISCNHIKNEGLIHIANCLMTKSLYFVNEVNFSECKLNFEGIKNFFKIVSFNQKLTTILFNRNNLYFKGFNDLDTSIAPMNLRKLGISGCGIGKYAVGVAELLLSNSTLHYLDISNNQIDDRTFKSFIPIPKENHSIKSLDFSRNFISDISGKPFFANLSMNFSLKHLNFFDNQLQNGTANTIIASLRVNKHLLKINLESNRIQYKMINEIKNCLKANYEIAKKKFVPQLKQKIKNLQFNPKEINKNKKKIYQETLEGQVLKEKLDDEIENYNKQRNDLLEKLKNIEESNVQILAETEKISQCINELQVNKNEENDQYKLKEREIQDLISNCQDEIEELEKKMEKMIEAQKIMKEDYENSIKKTELELKKNEDKVYLSEISLKNMKDELQLKTAKLETLEREKRTTESRKDTKEKKKNLQRRSSLKLQRKKSIKKMEPSDFAKVMEINEKTEKEEKDEKTNRSSLKNKKLTEISKKNNKKNKTNKPASLVKKMAKSKSAFNISKSNKYNLSPKQDNSDIINSNSKKDQTIDSSIKK